MSNCPFCDEGITYRESATRVHLITCLCCGIYEITDEALMDIRGKSDPQYLRQKANISGWLSENQQPEVVIYQKDLDDLFKIKTPSVNERANKILLAFEKMTPYLGHYLGIDKKWLSVGWCINRAELMEFVQLLLSNGTLANRHFGGGEFECKITTIGWEHLEKLENVNKDSQQGFVAMYFDKGLMENEVYIKAISEGILDAGYKPHLVSGREHNGKIDDEIIAQIRQSRFVLADFTGHRGGVYYEAGFAQGLGIKVLWTCKEDDLKELHFDIRQYNFIVWSPQKLDEFKKRIKYRIESDIGHGTYKREKIQQV